MKLRVLFTGIMMLMLSFAFAQDEASFTPDLAEGEKIFKTRCTACHKMDARLIGPALVGVTERRSEEWLIGFIRNSTEMIEAGDEEAVAIFEEFAKMPMIPNLDLSDDQIRNIIAYIDPAYYGEPEAEVAETEDPAAADQAGSDTPAAADAASSDAPVDAEKDAKKKSASMDWPPLAVGVVVTLMLLLLLLLLYFTATLNSIMKDKKG